MSKSADHNVFKSNFVFIFIVIFIARFAIVIRNITVFCARSLLCTNQISVRVSLECHRKCRGIRAHRPVVYKIFTASCRNKVIFSFHRFHNAICIVRQIGPSNRSTIGNITQLYIFHNRRYVNRLSNFRFKILICICVSISAKRRAVNDKRRIHRQCNIAFFYAVYQHICISIVCGIKSIILCICFAVAEIPPSRNPRNISRYGSICRHVGKFHANGVAAREIACRKRSKVRLISACHFSIRSQVSHKPITSVISQNLHVNGVEFKHTGSTCAVYDCIRESAAHHRVIRTVRCRPRRCRPTVVAYKPITFQYFLIQRIAKAHREACVIRRGKYTSRRKVCSPRRITASYVHDKPCAGIGFRSKLKRNFS